MLRMVLSWALAALPAAVTAEVLIPGAGRFEPYTGGETLLAFRTPEREASPAHMRPVRVVPRRDILDAIERTALSYARHPALPEVGLSTTEWVALFRSNIEIESAYDPNARSHAGAIGLGQLMPNTAARLGVDPHDWRENLDGSARYLLAMLNEFRDVDLGLAAYNAGPEAVRRHSGVPPYEETRNHVARVRAILEEIGAE